MVESSKMYWAVSKDKYLLACGHPLFMNKSYQKLEGGETMYCFKCMALKTVRYPRLVTVSGMPADEYWWKCLTPHCRKGRAQRTGQSGSESLYQASQHIRGFPQHRVHVVDLQGCVTDAFGRDLDEYKEEALPF